MMTRSPNVSSLMVGVLLAVAPLAPCRGQSEREFRLLDGLRARRLFSLAEFECRKNLGNASLDQRQRVDWGVELLRTETQRALNADPANRAPLWKKSHETAARLLAGDKESPRRVLIQVQDALTWLAEGRLMRLEAEVAAQHDAVLLHARTTIREAAKKLEQLDDQLARQSTAGTGRKDRQALTDDELFSLQHHVRFELARAFRNQALCYPPNSNDRVAALTRAVTQLDRIKGELRVGDDLLWQVYLDEAVCYRLLGSIEEARRVLTAPLSKSAPNAVRLQADGEQIRLELASGKPHDALDLLTQIRRTGQTGVPELDFAEVETYVALWRAASAAGQSENAKKWQAKVVATVRYLEETYGAYWGRRGELLLLRTAASSDHAGDNVDILERTGDDLYGKNRRGEAVAVYAKAAAQATASGADQRAFDLQLKAALVEQENHDYAAASQRLGRLVDDHPQNAKTAQAHLMAIWNTAQSARTDPKMLDRYTKMLDKHVAMWPLDPTTATARLWLGRFREGQRDWIAALAAYQHVPHDSTGFPQAVEGAARCWLNRLRDLRAAGRPTEHDAQAAIAFFDSLIRAPNGQWPNHWSEAQRIAVLAAAHIRLGFSKQQRNLTLEFLNTAIQRNRDAPDDWLQQANMLRIVALACQPAHRGKARQLLRRASTQSVKQELELVHLLGQLRDDAEGNSGPEIAQLQLIALDRLKPSLKQLDAAQQRKLAQLRAESLLAAGQRNEGIESFQQLAVEYPDDAAIQIRFAELLLERTEPASLRRALDQWRRVAQRLKPGTDAWYHAKLAIAQAYLKLGDRKEAADRLKYLQATSNVRQSQWGRQVQELLNECR